MTERATAGIRVERPLLLDPAFLQKLDTLSLLTRRRVRGAQRGERRSTARGRGLEFDDYRAYQPGDDYRYIDWHVVSRLDRLFVKMFSEEEDLDVFLMIDTSRSMAAGGPSKLLLAKQLAAAIGYIGLVNLDRVGVSAFASTIGPRLDRLRGRARAFDLLGFLSGLEPSGETDLTLAMRRQLAATRRRGLLVVLTDLLDPHGYERALLLARHRRFETYLIHILADEELVPAFAGDLRLVDAETGRAVEVTVDAEALRAYAEARDAFLHGVERFCFRHGVEYLRTTTTVPVETLVLRWLRQGGLLQ
ncbi:MAG TPA: DUF58 domain-containing protein [bacterium]|nr:DUF58 domain-containing protein [bacterium]